MDGQVPILPTGTEPGEQSVPFTVVTPTYNRKHTLPQLYASLRAQTFREFEWVIVDDGSTDGTAELVADWLKDPPSFPIRYVRQEHAHEKAAINRAARLARGELFVVADSDDELVPQALEVLHRAWQSVPDGERPLYAGVLCLCRDADGHVVGETFPEWALAGVPADAFLTTLRVKGEKWGCTRTELWRRYPYPENIPGFVPEGTGAHQRFKGLQVLCLNEALRIYHQDAGWQLSRHSRPDEVAAGHLYYRKEVLDYPWHIVRHRPFDTALDAARWTRFRLHVARRFGRRSAQACGVEAWLPRSVLGRALIVLMAPVGLALWLRDVARRGRTG